VRHAYHRQGWKWIPNWITHDLSRRVGRGVFSIPEAQGQDHDPAADSQSPKTVSDSPVSSESMADECSNAGENAEATNAFQPSAPVPA
jgi:hypothetical protein